MTVNGQTERIGSSLYIFYPAENISEAEYDIYLFREVYTETPAREPAFYVGIEASESLYGKTIDLTEPLAQATDLQPYLYLTARGGNREFYIDYDEGRISAENGATVTEGTLFCDRSGDEFTVKLNVKLSDGKSAAADWKGTSKLIDDF